MNHVVRSVNSRHLFLFVFFVFLIFECNTFYHSHVHSREMQHYSDFSLLPGSFTPKEANVPHVEAPVGALRWWYLPPRMWWRSHSEAGRITFLVTAGSCSLSLSLSLSLFPTPTHPPAVRLQCRIYTLQLENVKRMYLIVNSFTTIQNLSRYIFAKRMRGNRKV